MSEIRYNLWGLAQCTIIFHPYAINAFLVCEWDGGWSIFCRLVGSTWLRSTLRKHSMTSFGLSFLLSSMVHHINMHWKLLITTRLEKFTRAIYARHIQTKSRERKNDMAWNCINCSGPRCYTYRVVLNKSQNQSRKLHWCYFSSIIFIL